MRVSNYIKEVIKSFFLLTNVPVQYYDYEGNRASQYGLSTMMEEIFNEYDLYSQLKNNFNEEKTDTITIKDDIHFTILPICPRNKYRGHFILGAYTSNIINKNIPYKPLALKHNMIDTLRLMWRNSPNISSADVNNNPYSFHVKKAIDYIDSRYMDNISLDDISDYLEINKSYFCTIFKEETGSTFTEFLNKVRVNNSKKLLLNKNVSVLDIALSVGFNNQNYFNIVFKKLTGQTPLEYRNKNTF